MLPQAGQTLQLLDARHRRIGEVVVEDSTEDLIAGTFQPGPDYPAVERLVREFEEAVNDQALAVVEGIDAALAALGLQLSFPDGVQRLAVRDVQIWSDGAFSCRPASGVDIPVNGSQEAARPAQPAKEG